MRLETRSYVGTVEVSGCRTVSIEGSSGANDFTGTIPVIGSIQPALKRVHYCTYTWYMHNAFELVRMMAS